MAMSKTCLTIDAGEPLDLRLNLRIAEFARGDIIGPGGFGQHIDEGLLRMPGCGSLERRKHRVRTCRQLRGDRHDDPFTQFTLGGHFRSQVAARQRREVLFLSIICTRIHMLSGPSIRFGATRV